MGGCKCVLEVLVAFVICFICRAAPLNVCDRVPIHTTAFRSKGDGGFSILVKGLQPGGKYIPGQTYTVVVKNTDLQKTENEFLGLMLTAVPEGAKNETISIGNFSTLTHTVKKEESCEGAILVHHYLDPKKRVKVNWTAPAYGCVEFRATVISINLTTWYKDDGGLTLKICSQDLSTNEEQLLGDASAQSDSPECCACGEARYKMVFQGLWSRQTHPKDFPTGKDALLLHWSNVVGATHTEDYHIWKYGGYAERGVREVCEYGYSTKLETDMKKNSDKIYTVIKTNAMWGNVLGKREAVFKVNQKAHLLSLLTMVGPSPDWCVGIPAMSMCNANCTWVDELVVDLYPWDAGTDEGTRYVNERKVPQEPPERIREITNTWPNFQDSPFYGPHKVKSMARVTLTKLKEHCGSDDSQQSVDDVIPSTEDLINMMKKKMMMTKKLEMMKCATTEWSLWTECSASCGTGMRQRSRELINENILPSMCKHELMQKEQCQGDCLENTPRKQGRDKLNEKFEIRHTFELDLNDPCVVTPWSDWSPCSARVCGRGVREKWRMFLRKEAQNMNCNVEIMEKDVCYAPIPDCRKAAMMKNFTAICSLPKNDGPCRGSFQRWYYDSGMRKCLPFRYGGCRGNDNKFETKGECDQQCAKYMASIDSAISSMNKAELTQPSRLEIERMMKKKKQMMANNRGQNNIPELNDVNNESLDFVMRKKRKMMQREKRKMMKKQRQMEKAKMRERKRQMRQKKRRMKKKNMVAGNGNDVGPVIDCMVTEWTPWEPCTATCGKQYISRSRMIKAQPQNGGKKCPKKLTRRRKCKGLPRCSRDCKVNDWGDWSSCSATCGTNAVRERIRDVMVKPKHGGMECPSLKERQSCNLPACMDSKEMKEFMEAMQKSPPS